MSHFLTPPAFKAEIPAGKIDKQYKRLRLQVFIGIFVGYAGYYLVRKNFTMAMPELEQMGYGPRSSWFCHFCQCHSLCFV